MAVAALAPARSNVGEYARDARPARLLALLLDSIVFLVISFVINNVYGVTQVYNWPSVGIGVGTYATIVPWPVATAVWLLYYFIPEALFGASPGKQMLRLKVVRLDGRPLGAYAIFVRNLLRPLDALPLLYLIGGVAVVWTAGSQRIGDMAAGTTVVYRHRALMGGATRSSGAIAPVVLAAALIIAVLYTIGFNYFGRPPLIVEVEFNQHLLIGHLDTYALGRPTWGWGTVTYPLQGRAGDQICAGSIDFKWEFLGWSEGSSGLTCVPS
jgi:uncharacterized RDD family membrane protein YckC